MTAQAKTIRLIIDEPADGVWNMAVDEALLAAIHEVHAVPVLRWYQWSAPTLSLGYFQRWNDVPAGLSDLPRVRRSTGGGAILHADELTYSLAFPTGSWPTKSGLAIVEEVHAAAAEAIQFFSPQLKIATPSAVQDVRNTPEPFLCFERRSAHDLVTGADKIMGSAQRRQCGRLLQHGSIPLRGWNAGELAMRITELLSKRWNVTFKPSSLTAEELQSAEEFVVKHRSLEWTQRR
jgi:lipoate-protein ligase A